MPLLLAVMAILLRPTLQIRRIGRIRVDLVIALNVVDVFSAIRSRVLIELHLAVVA
jgi:hypothetical protein